MFTMSNAHIAKHPDLFDSTEKLAVVGEIAGFTTAQMVDLLTAGLTMETLLDLIAWRLERLGERPSGAAVEYGPRC
jgi:uncharacterized protein YfaQ (DUF2300 family)